MADGGTVLASGGEGGVAQRSLAAAGSDGVEVEAGIGFVKECLR